MTRFTVALGVATVAAFAAGAAFVVAPTRPPSAPTVTGPELCSCRQSLPRFLVDLVVFPESV